VVFIFVPIYILQLNGGIEGANLNLGPEIGLKFKLVLF